MANYERVKQWRENTKRRAVDSMGGGCILCGYDRCTASLAFHHLDPTQKDFGIAKSIRSWSNIVEELRKCVLLCHNCHSEVHAGLVEVPEDCLRFDESFSEYKEPVEKEVDHCPICSSLKPVSYITCSRSCAAHKSRKVDWFSVDLLKELQTKSYVQIATELGVSDAAVRKRYQKYFTI